MGLSDGAVLRWSEPCVRAATEGWLAPVVGEQHAASVVQSSGSPRVRAVSSGTGHEGAVGGASVAAARVSADTRPRWRLTADRGPRDADLASWGEAGPDAGVVEPSAGARAESKRTAGQSSRFATQLD